MKQYQKERLATIRFLEIKLKTNITPWQRFNYGEQLRLLKRMIKIDELTEKRLKPQLLKTKKKGKK
jgi:hypothetical protein